jgi:hypothetical protein
MVLWNLSKGTMIHAGSEFRELFSTTSRGNPFKLSSVTQHEDFRIRRSLIASFYLVDRRLWHRLPGISSF